MPKDSAWRWRRPWRRNCPWWPPATPAIWNSCHRGCAELVPYRLAPILQSEGDYQAGWHWAEPDIDTAAAMLRRLASDAVHHRALATAGRSAVERMLGPQRIAAIAAQRLGALLRWAGRAELLAALPAEHRFRQLEG